MSVGIYKSNSLACTCEVRWYALSAITMLTTVYRDISRYQDITSRASESKTPPQMLHTLHITKLL